MDRHSKQKAPLEPRHREEKHGRQAGSRSCFLCMSDDVPTSYCVFGDSFTCFAFWWILLPFQLCNWITKQLLSPQPLRPRNIEKDRISNMKPPAMKTFSILIFKNIYVLYLSKIRSVERCIFHLSKPQSELQTIVYRIVANDFSPSKSRWFFLGKVKLWWDEVFIVTINYRNVEKEQLLGPLRVRSIIHSPPLPKLCQELWLMQ